MVAPYHFPLIHSIFGYFNVSLLWSFTSGFFTQLEPANESQIFPPDPICKVRMVGFHPVPNGTKFGFCGFCPGIPFPGSGMQELTRGMIRVYDVFFQGYILVPQVHWSFFVEVVCSIKKIGSLKKILVKEFWPITILAKKGCSWKLWQNLGSLRSLQLPQSWVASDKTIKCEQMEGPWFNHIGISGNLISLWYSSKCQRILQSWILAEILMEAHFKRSPLVCFESRNRSFGICENVYEVTNNKQSIVYLPKSLLAASARHLKIPRPRADLEASCL